MALALALTIVLLTLATCGLFVLHPWWFPASVSTFAFAIDHQFTLTLAVCGVLLATAQIVMAYFVWRYRGERQNVWRPTAPASTRLEHVWAAVAAVLFLTLGATGYRVWARAALQGPAAPDALRVEVWGEQFEWYFRYPGPDGQFGPVYPSLMNDGTGNSLGLDREHDAASRDDIITATLAVPVDQPVELTLRSKDVIHSFFVRELRLKQDVIPGTISVLHLTARRTGRYEIVCAELCGLGHYKMHADLDVMTAGEFREWLLEQAKRQ
ncbi:MAG TPA: cytochrome c oxidase subunit II [Terriglobia bacterium]|nr:cytochrome c oxidase subunit II [Terriglobia bacterium]